MKHIQSTAITALLSIVALGCNRPTPASLATDPMAAPAMAVSDAATHPKRFREQFVDGAVPDDKARKHFNDFNLIIVGVTPVSETEAMVHVLVDDNSGKRVAEKDWTVAKADGRWKLKSAPLP
jgi:hypothetical protein